jgi:hypothetical protein
VFLDSYNFHSILKIRDRISQAHKTSVKIVVLDVYNYFDNYYFKMYNKNSGFELNDDNYFLASLS